MELLISWLVVVGLIVSCITPSRIWKGGEHRIKDKELDEKWKNRNECAVDKLIKKYKENKNG